MSLVRIFYLKRDGINMFDFFKDSIALKIKKGPETVGEGIVPATIMLQDFINAVKNKTVIDYENNRGNGKLNSTKVYNIASNYDVNKLGVITVADWEDGTYKKADAHHRTAAIVSKYFGKNGISPFTPTQDRKSVV